MGQEWHYLQNGSQHGPISEVDLKQLIAAGKLQPTDLLWKQGMSQWVPAHSVAGIFPQANPPVATLVPPPGPVKTASPTPAVPAEAVKAVPVSVVGKATAPAPTQDDKPGLVAGIQKRLQSEETKALVQKAKAKWQAASTPVKAGIIGGAAVGVFLLLLLFCILPLRWFFGGSSDSSSSLTQEKKVAGGGSSGSKKLTRLEFVNKLIVKNGNQPVKSLEAKIDQFGGGFMVHWPAGVQKFKDGRVFVNNALGGRFDHDWWVKTFGDFQVEDFFDPCDNEMLRNGAGKWTYQCADGPISFIGSIVEAENSPTGRRLITLRRFGLF